MTAITELVFLPELQSFHWDFSVPEVASLTISLSHGFMDVLFLKFSQHPFVTIQAWLWRKPRPSHSLLRGACGEKNEDAKQKDQFYNPKARFWFHRVSLVITREFISKAPLLRNLPFPLFSKEGLIPSLWQREVRRDLTPF